MKISKETIRASFNNRRYQEAQLSAIAMFRIKSILEFVGNKKKVLDIACADGTISQLVAQNNNDVYGIDISEAAIKMAKEKGIKAYKLDVECEGLPFSDNYFDIVIAAEIIEHIFDTDKFLNKIKKILRPQGHLIITTPNLATLGRRLLLLLGKNPLVETSIAADAAGHIRYFIKETLINLLEKHSFNINIFGSDIVNFHSCGRFYSVALAKMFPTIGRTLIIKAENIK